MRISCELCQLWGVQGKKSWNCMELRRDGTGRTSQVGQWRMPFVLGRCFCRTTQYSIHLKSSLSCLENLQSLWECGVRLRGSARNWARVLLISGSMQLLKLVGINQMLKACQYGQIAKILYGLETKVWANWQRRAERKATATLRRSPVAGTSGDLSTKAGGEFRNFEQKTPDKMWPQRNSRHL